MMKIALPNKRTKRRIQKTIGVMVLLTMASCTSPENQIFKDAMESVQKGQNQEALDLFDKVTKRSPETGLGIRAAREAARVSFYEVKNHKKAAEYLKLLILWSRDPADRMQAQQQLAAIYFDNLQDYKSAVVEYYKLAQLSKTVAEEAQYRTNLARAHYYLNDFAQAEIEIQSVLKLKTDTKTRFAAQTLNGNILLAQRKYKEASTIFSQTIKEFPEQAILENTYLNLAVCLEELGDFANAIKTLEGLQGKYSPPEYLELRIKRLKERQKNQPGARGFRK